MTIPDDQFGDIDSLLRNAIACQQAAKVAQERAARAVERLAQVLVDVQVDNHAKDTPMTADEFRSRWVEDSTGWMDV